MSLNQILSAILTGTIGLLVSGGMYAADAPAGMPNPLTLEAALAMADELDPALKIHEAEIQSSQASHQGIDAENDINAYLEGRLRYINPPAASPDQSHDDHRYGVVINKSLYDFGRRSAKLDAAEQEVTSRQLGYQDVRMQRRLEIIRRFFDVLLADTYFARNNEEMATDFIRFDRLNQRKELGQVSDVQVLEAEATYQRTRLRRYESQAQQRVTRAKLAEVLNRPGQLPDALVAPDLKILEQQIPEIEIAQKQALDNNLSIQALRARVKAAELRMAATRAEDNPTLIGSAEAFKYSREIGSNDEVRVGMTLTVPIYTGRRDDAALAQARSQLQQTRATLQLAESNLRQRVLELVIDLDNLRVQREQMTALRKFRELNLDRSRALYEMEVRADLGDAMVLITDAEYLSAQTDYKMAHTRLQLDILTGQSAMTVQTSNPTTAQGAESHVKQ